MPGDCVFCKLPMEVSAEIVYEDDDILALKIFPLLPRSICDYTPKHIPTLLDLNE